MAVKGVRPLVVGAVLGAVGVVLAPALAVGVAGAQPPPVQPGPGLPWTPGAPLAGPGSYQYYYNVIPVPPPAAFDARGVRAAVSNDPAAAASGLPGSALGLSPNKANMLTSSSTRYRIGAGSVANPSLPTVTPGTNIGAGMEVPVLEDPGGAAPKTPVGAESSQPTSAPAVPGQPAPILEAASGTPAPATPSPTPTPSAGPPTPEVAAAAPPNS
jgi:hypothetical protein